MYATADVDNGISLLGNDHDGDEYYDDQDGNTRNGEYGLMDAALFRRSVDTDGKTVSQEERMLNHYLLPMREPTKRPNTNSKKIKEKATKILTLEPTH